MKALTIYAFVHENSNQYFRWTFELSMRNAISCCSIFFFRLLSNSFFNLIHIQNMHLVCWRHRNLYKFEFLINWIPLVVLLISGTHADLHCALCCTLHNPYSSFCAIWQMVNQYCASVCVCI